MIERVKELLKKHNITLAAHYYQKDEIFDIADLTGDSLDLAKKTAKIKNPLIFCGVSFMGESAKILNPSIPVYMPKLASCSMARMAEVGKVKKDIQTLKENNIDLVTTVRGTMFGFFFSDKPVKKYFFHFKLIRHYFTMT